MDEFHLAGVQYENQVFSAITSEKRSEFNEKTQTRSDVKMALLNWSFNYLYGYKGRTEKNPQKLDEVLLLLNESKIEQIFDLLKVDSWVLLQRIWWPDGVF